MEREKSADEKMKAFLSHFEVIVVDPGDMVNCDYCNADWTDREESGGILVGSKAVCPDCTPDAIRRIEGYGELWSIKSKCPPGMSFADWVRKELR